MTGQLSPAQTLPIDVLRSIMKWVIQENKSLLRGDSSKLYLLKEVLPVCSAWRTVALEFLWRRLWLNIHIVTNKVYLGRPKWVKDDRLPYNATYLAKEIHVTVPMSGIVSGVAHNLLVDYIGDTTFFPLVNKLVIEIEYYTDQYFDTQDIAMANVLKFAKLLKSMISAETTVEVVCDGLCYGTESQRINASTIHSRDVDNEILTLTNVLYANTKHARLDLLMVNLIKLSTIEHISLLTSLKLNCERSPDVHIGLVRKSASTLQKLELCIRDANMLICDTNGETVIYPNLQYFIMTPSYISRYDAITRASDVIPFPALRVLILNSLYPFHDDVMLRGNSATLEYLNITIDNYVVTMFNRCKTFETKCKVLKHVVVNEGPNIEHMHIIPTADMNKFLDNLASAAHELSVMGLEIPKVCIVAVQHSQWFKNIKVIEVRSNNLLFTDMMSLLKELPNVVYFGGSGGALGPELENISAEDLPEYVISTYGNLGKNLHTWHMVQFAGVYTSIFIDYILLLTLVCPNIRYVELLSHVIPEYYENIAKALESGPYSRYPLQVKQLLKAVCEF